MAAAESSDRVNTRSRSMNFVTWFEPAIPIAMPMPNATTTTPHPAAFACSVEFTKIGPSASTAPTAANAITMPAVIADAIESSRRNRTPVERCRARSARDRTAPRPRDFGAFERDAAHHERRERERAPIQQQRQRLGSREADRRADQREHREHRAAERQRRVRADQPDRVRVRELPSRDQVRQRRVARRRPQQREAFDHERQQEDEAEPVDERHRGVQARRARCRPGS